MTLPSDLLIFLPYLSLTMAWRYTEGKHRERGTVREGQRERDSEREGQ